jgi:hypothetical protein
MGKQSMKFVDAAVMLDEGDKWGKLFQDIFAIKAR